MANITLLHELQMFAKTSGSKMTVFEAVKEYYGRVLDDIIHLSARGLLTQKDEGILREMLDSSILDEKQELYISVLLTAIGLAKAEEAISNPNYYFENEDYYDVVPEGALPPYAPFAHENIPF